MILDLGTIDYQEAYNIQRELVVKRRLNEIDDSLVIAEHPTVFTIGRSGSRRNLLADEKYLSIKGIEVLDVDRGGDITLHSPGQLVVYPIINLNGRVMDLHNYLRDLEGSTIGFLKRYGVTGSRIKGATGVWVGERKTAFIGIAAKGWVTYHGASVNISNDLELFSMINPCGMRNIKVTSLIEILGREIDMREARKILLAEFCGAFGLEGAG